MDWPVYENNPLKKKPIPKSNTILTNISLIDKTLEKLMPNNTYTFDEELLYQAYMYDIVSMRRIDKALSDSKNIVKTLGPFKLQYDLSAFTLLRGYIR